MYILVCLSELYWYASYKHVDQRSEKAAASMVAVVQNRQRGLRNAKTKQ
jgi:hypothetical protein